LNEVFDLEQLQAEFLAAPLQKWADQQGPAGVYGLY
jgi:hypothetical protein